MDDTKSQEKQLIEDAKANPKKFEALYVKYYESIVKFVYKRVENIEDCREVTAVVFSKAISNLKSYQDYGFPFSSWLYRIAINEITQFYRDKSKTRIITANEKALTNLKEESREQKTDMIATLREALHYLEEDDLTVIELRFFEERPFAEVGEILGITENNAKVRTYRAIDRLKEIYKQL